MLLARRFHAQRTHGGGHFAAGLFDIVNGAGNDAAFGAVEQGGFLRNEALFVSFHAGVVECPPAEGITGLDDFVEGFALAFTQPHGFLGAEVRAHDLQQRKARATDLGHQPLADNPAQRVGQPHADLFLLLRLKHAQNAVDGFTGIDRVQGAEDQMAGFRGAQGDFHRVAIAHFADENDLGRLAQRGAQAVDVRIEINAQFTLVERRPIVRMNIFHRVFQSDDVEGLGCVDFVQNGGQCGGFAGAGGAGDKNQAGFFLRDELENFRELQLIQRGDDRIQLAADDGIISALGEDIDAETALVRERVGGVTGTVAQQIFNLPKIVANDVHRDGFGLIGCELFDGRVERHRFELAVSLDLRRAIHRKQNIGNLRL